MINKILSDSAGEKMSNSRLPVFFIGHGSPMNAIEDNPYTNRIRDLGSSLGKPKAVLMISAHWLSQGRTLVAEALKPKTIHDFGGFPKELYQVQYPAPGSPEIAKWLEQQIQDPPVLGDGGAWGLDHGAWSVLRHLYPQADVPVVQLSIDITQGPEFHFKLGQQLAVLRDQGVLIIGSGNLVHNLRMIQFDQNQFGYDWAIEFDEWTKKNLEQRNTRALLSQFHDNQAGRLSVPSMDHYLPLAFILGAADSKDELRFEYEEMQMGSISMRSFSFGRKSTT